MAAEVRRREILKAVVSWMGGAGWAGAQETLPVGKTPADQARNAELLSGYDYPKYEESLTGYTGQDRQQIAFWRCEHAVRTRVGPRGNYKAGLSRLSSGELIIAVCHRAPDPATKHMIIVVCTSLDQGLTWREISRTPLYGKEPSLTGLPDGSLVLTAEPGHGPGYRPDELPVSRSEDGGRTWETKMIPGPDIPRNLIVGAGGSLLMVRARDSAWYHKEGGGSPHLQLCRSQDGGRTWEFSEGVIDWDSPAFGEVAAIRLRSGQYLAALRRTIPGTRGEGFEDTVVTQSFDGGHRWSKPWRMGQTAEVHTYLTELRDGRILATYSNYHLPWGVFAILSTDGGRNWDLERPIQLALSADFYVGWPVTLQLPDGSLVTSYAATTYYKQPPDRYTCEVVRWHLP